MNQYQSALSQLTESVGTVSMVNVEQIKTQQNLDYLEHLCSFIDRMNINPIWFENEDNSNKLKILEIYQLAITYSNNLSVSYQRSISEKEAQVKRLRDAEKEKMSAVRNHKDEYQLLRQRYKLKKHQLYKFMYDNLRNKVRQEESFRDTRRDREPKSEVGTPEIIYYYPNPSDPTNPVYQYPPYVPPLPQLQHPYDPRVWPQNQSHPPPPPYAYYPPGDGTNRQPQLQFLDTGNNIKSQANATKELNIQQISSNRGDSSIQYRQFLNEGSSNKPQHVPAHQKQKTPKNRKSVVESDGEEGMQKSKIITSGQKFFEKIDQQIKLKTDKSLSRDSGVKKKESVRFDSREEDDDFGNLTVNSRKKDTSVKLSKKDSITEDQEQFDSIAHIKLVTDSSAKSLGPTPNPNRFQSKIYGKQVQQIKPPTPKYVPEKNPESQADDQANEVSSIMHSTYSKNNPAQVEKLFDPKNPPKRGNGQTMKNTNFRLTEVKEQNIQDIKGKAASNQNESNKQTSKEPQKLLLQRPKRVNQEKLPAQQLLKPSPRQNNRDLNEKIEKSIDIFQSNVGRVQNKKEQIDIFTSNIGHGSGNSKDSQGERLLTERPKRANQVQPPIPLPNKSPIPSGSNRLEIPQIKKPSNQLNQLVISVAQSEEMKNSNMLYSQAKSLEFRNSEEAEKMPPKLQKQILEDEQYEEDFYQYNDMDQLENSHLPISQNKQQKPASKSQVNIHLSSIPTTKQIVKDKFVSLPNQTFDLMTNNVQPPNKNAAGSNISESDNFFDEILEMPMNSKIAKRPEIHKFQAASSVPQRTSIDTKQLESRKTLVGSGKIEEAVAFLAGGSPSIHLIGVDGHKQRLQQRGGIDRFSKQRMSSEQTPLFKDAISDKDRIDNSRSSELKEFNAESKVIGGKQTSLLDLIKREGEKPEKIEAEQDGEINLDDLLEQSKIQPIKNPSKKQESKKNDGKAIKTAISKIQAQPPAFKDPRKFDEGIFDRILKEHFKIKVTDVRTEEKWENIEKYFQDQCDKVKSILQNEKMQKQDRIKQEISRQEKSENASTPKSINRQSNYDDLQYSQSNLKIQNKLNNKSSTVQTDLINSITDSITIQDPPKIEQKVTPKNAENKYSRSGKPKADIKGEITKNINLGKHDYDVDDPLNLAIIQNRQLLNDQEDSEFD